MKLETQFRVATVKLPATVFKKCSRCDSPNLWSEEGQVFCDYCGWNSIELYEECVAAAEKRVRESSVPANSALAA